MSCAWSLTSWQSRKHLPNGAGIRPRRLGRNHCGNGGSGNPSAESCVQLYIGKYGVLVFPRGRIIRPEFSGWDGIKGVHYEVTALSTIGCVVDPELCDAAKLGSEPGQSCSQRSARGQFRNKKPCPRTGGPRRSG